MVDFIRHGESEGNLARPGLISGRDPEAALTENGRAQVKRLAEAYVAAGIKIDHYYSSNLRRAIESVGVFRAVMKADGGANIGDPRLTEISQGEWEGRDRKETYTDDLRAEMDRLGPHFRAPGGESQWEAKVRMYDWLQDVPGRHDPDRDLHIVAFSHGNAMKCLFMHGFAGTGEKNLMKVELGNARIMRVHYGLRGWIMTGKWNSDSPTY